MNAAQLRQMISSGIEGLPPKSLKEIADFVVFVRLRTLKPQMFEQAGLAEVLQEELTMLEASELLHLEEEFAGYENIFPRE